MVAYLCLDCMDLTVSTEFHMMADSAGDQSGGRSVILAESLEETSALLPPGAPGAF